MLYVTTRNKTDAYTANNTLLKERGNDGGLFVPFRLPKLSDSEICALKDKTFGQCVAETLNLFFSARLDGWDVDFTVGRYPARLVSMSHKIIIGETWNNPEWDIARVVRNLNSRIRGTEDSTAAPSNWAWITVRIAMLFGLFGELARMGITDNGNQIDISVCTEDFSAPMAAWYAREMGLPIGNIICSCNDNSAAWDLLHQGQLHTDCDGGVPENLERLIYTVLGWEEAERFCRCCESKKLYVLDELQLSQLRRGMFVSVVSGKRMESVISSVYKTNTYLLDPNGALAFSGLQDHRAVTGVTGPALILSERSPVCAAETVAGAVGITPQELKGLLGVR